MSYQKAESSFDFSDVPTVQDQGWTGLKNGELMVTAAEKKYFTHYR